MPDTAAEQFMKHWAPGRQEHRIVDRRPQRLGYDHELGAAILPATNLAPGTALSGAGAEEKIEVRGALKVRVRWKADAECTGYIYPVLADGTTKASTSVVNSGAVAADTEDVMEYDVVGDEYVIILIDPTTTANLTHVDVYIG